MKTEHIDLTKDEDAHQLFEDYLEDPDALIMYFRKGDAIRIKFKGNKSFTNYEMRAVLVGLWLTLKEEDRIDFIQELMHYHLEDGNLPPLSEEISGAVRMGWGE